MKTTRRNLLAGSAALSARASSAGQAAPAPAAPPAGQRIEWWREARFGLFIHWGIWSVAAGTVHGQQIEDPSDPSCLITAVPMPAAEYLGYARRFNPVSFDADQWVRLARQAGMKYIVITAKHHDGFAMFDSAHSQYTITRATPFRRDPLQELAGACRRHGLKLCFYYSQNVDWTAEQVEFRDAPKDGDFPPYLAQKALPQVRELLSNYGPIGAIWFDIGNLSRVQAQAFADLVRNLQPAALVNGRIGPIPGDYTTWGDNQLPTSSYSGDSEMPATMNHNWGDKSYDQDWMPAPDLLNVLASCAARGVNYLLNVGPTDEGLIPEPAADRLRAIGRWMDTNSGAIYGTRGSPYPFDFPWGLMTQKGHRLFLLVKRWPGPRLVFHGLRNRVLSARLLARPDAGLRCVEEHRPESDRHVLEIRLPYSAPDPDISVIELTLDGPPDVDRRLRQFWDNSFVFPAHAAEIQAGPAGARPVLERQGVVTGIDRGRLEWPFTVYRTRVTVNFGQNPEPMRFRLNAATERGRWNRAPWVEGTVFDIALLDARGARLAHFEAPLRQDEEPALNRFFHEYRTVSRLGDLVIPEPGEYRLTLSVPKLGTRALGRDLTAEEQKRWILRFAGLELLPVPRSDVTPGNW